MVELGNVDKQLERITEFFIKEGYKQIRNSPAEVRFAGETRIIRIDKFVSMLWISVEKERHQGVANNGICLMIDDILSDGFEKDFKRRLEILKGKADNA